MAESEANAEKARYIFERVFEVLKVKWSGPEFDFDRDSYKALIQSGDLKGRLAYISVERLSDMSVSAEDVKQEILGQLQQD